MYSIFLAEGYQEVIHLKHPAEYSIQWVLNKKQLIISHVRVRYFLVAIFHSLLTCAHSHMHPSVQEKEILQVGKASPGTCHVQGAFCLRPTGKLREGENCKLPMEQPNSQPEGTVPSPPDSLLYQNSCKHSTDPIGTKK